MPVRLRKLLGTVFLVWFVATYAVLATAFASLYLAESAAYVHLFYFLVTGVLWVVPAALVIRWMEGPKPA